MRVIVFGAGAVGGVLASRLVRSGEDVAVVARGSHLDAIRRNGLTVEDAQGACTTVMVEANDDAGALRPADVVLVTLKSFALADAAERIAALQQPRGVTVFLQNGLPWWFFRGLAALPDGVQLASTDPGGRLAAAFAPGSIGAGTLYTAVALQAPGHIRHIAGQRIDLGSPDAPDDPRLLALAAALHRAGFDARHVADPRPQVWRKLAVNIAHSGVSALTGSRTRAMWSDAALAPLLVRLADEAAVLSAAFGMPVTVDMDERRRAATDHKTSLLQDLEAGRRIEYEAIYGGVLELADVLGVEIPTIRTIAGLLRHRAAAAGCLPPPGR
ncbi:MAG: ketopantoate reductase family protein [Geminicoccaceae bacterium]